VSGPDTIEEMKRVMFHLKRDSYIPRFIFLFQGYSEGSQRHRKERKQKQNIFY
jgi:hypothetical protein